MAGKLMSDPVLGQWRAGFIGTTAWQQEQRAARAAAAPKPHGTGIVSRPSFEPGSARAVLRRGEQCAMPVIIPVQGSAPLLRMLRRLRTIEAGRQAVRAALRAARVRETARRAVLRTTVQCAPAPPAPLTLQDKWTLIERADGTPWRPGISEWQVRKLRKAGMPDVGTIRRRGIGMVSGTEVRGSERWSATPAAVRVIVRRDEAGNVLSTEPLTTPCRVSWDGGRTWHPFTRERATADGTAAPSGTPAAAPLSYSERLARFGADVSLAGTTG